MKTNCCTPKEALEVLSYEIFMHTDESEEERKNAIATLTALIDKHEAILKRAEDVIKRYSKLPSIFSEQINLINYILKGERPK